MPKTKPKEKAAEKFFKFAELPTKDIEVEGFGKVRLRQLSELERYRNLEQWLRDDAGEVVEARQEEIPYRMLILSCYEINPDGTTGPKMFEDNDLGRLVHSSSSALLGLLQATIDLNTGEPIEKK